MTDNPLLTPQRIAEEADAAVRPKTLTEFVGQAVAKDNLRLPTPNPLAAPAKL